MSEDNFSKDSLPDGYASEKWNIDRVIEKLKGMPSTQEKIRYLQLERIEEQQIVLEVGILLKKFGKAIPQFKTYIKWCELEIERLKLLEPDKEKESTEKQLSEPVEIEQRIIFKPKAVPKIYEALKDYFPMGQQPELKRILKSGGDAPHPLFFMDKGNKLAAAFRRLKESEVVTSCTKKELEDWLCRNFTFTKMVNGKKMKSHFTADYAEKCISRDSKEPSNPIPLDF